MIKGKLKKVMARIRRTSEKPSLFTKLPLALYLIAGVGLLISYLPPYARPASFWAAAFFRWAYPFPVIANLFFLFVWLLRRKRRFWIPLLLLLAGLPFHSRHFGFRLPSHQPLPDSALQIMSFNSHSLSRYGKNFRDRKSTRLNYSS